MRMRAAVMMFMDSVAIIMMVIYRHHDRQWAVMSRAASCLDRCSEPLDGQRGDHQPKQKYLEDAIHLHAVHLYTQSIMEA